MDKRKLSIVILVISTLILSLITFFVVTQNQRKTDLVAAKSVSETFIKDYTTYKVSSPDEYNQRVSEHISPNYKESFLAKYALGPVASLDQGTTKDYSKYKSSQITVSSTGALGVYDAKITFTVEILDSTLSSTASTETNTININLAKSGGKLLITSFGFEE